MSVTLKNVSRRMQSYNLDAAALESQGPPFGFKTITVTVVEQGSDGKMYPKRITKKICSSLHFSVNEERGGLPDEVLSCTEISSALGRRDIVRVDRPAAPAPSLQALPVPAPASVASSSATEKTSKRPTSMFSSSATEKTSKRAKES